MLVLAVPRQPPLYFPLMDQNDGIAWLDEIASDPKYEWHRVGSRRITTDLGDDLPCYVMLGNRRGVAPVLHLAVGHNCTVHYWQWTSVDRDTGEALPREEAIRRLWRVIDLTIKRTRSAVVPELVGWAAPVLPA